MADDWGQAEQQEQDFAFDGGEVNASELMTGDIVDKEGWYHFEVVNVKNDFDLLNDQGKPKSPCVVLTCNVLAGEKGKSPAGSKYFHRIYVASKEGGAAADGARNSALRFGLGIGLLKGMEKDGVDVVVDAATGSTRIPANIWAKAVGKQFVAKIALEKAEEGSKFKDKYQVPFGRVYHPLDPAVESCPKNSEALAMLGNVSPPPPPGKDASHQQRQAPAKQAAAPAKPADDDFSDL